MAPDAIEQAIVLEGRKRDAARRTQFIIEGDDGARWATRPGVGAIGVGKGDRQLRADPTCRRSIKFFFNF